ncbi:MAG: hypothetical protein Tsb0016_07720 [Sphingomonadales bacterium]
MANNQKTAPHAANSETGPEIDYGGLDESLGFHIRLAHATICRNFARAMADINLTQKQCATLRLIAANPGMPQVALARIISTDRATMMALINRLERSGLVERRPAPRDGRRQAIYLTPLGHQTLARAKEIIAAHERRLTRDFSESERQLLLTFLKRLHEID